ncbi:hypothetical protein [Methylophaga nitratireducenticrescens]|uniref:hypothetical protein n=1 Tax=Methylophaga nitratireducenticrescens TaxID=754476 RepID=UPI0019310C71|nr:hypothetical protein [Methylophaga nitratireducenticrescens]
MSDTQSSASPLPCAPGFDSTLALQQKGYDFIRNRSQQMDTDMFETRLLLKPTICMVGREASEIFYDETKFK